MLNTNDTARAGSGMAAIVNDIFKGVNIRGGQPRRRLTPEEKEEQRQFAAEQRRQKRKAWRVAASIRHGIPEADVDAYKRLIELPVYKQLEKIVHAYIVFMLGNAIILAADVAFGVEILSNNALTQSIDFVSMAFGLLMTAIFIHAVYKGLKYGVFQGLQQKAAQLFLLIAFADESASIAAKFNADVPGMIDLYTGYILPLTAPMICLFAFMLILSEPYARRYRKEKVAGETLDHEMTMSDIQKKNEKVRAERRERTTREIATTIHGLKLRARALGQSFWSSYAWEQAGRQSRGLIKDVVQTNTYAVTEKSGDGQASKGDVPSLAVNVGAEKKARRGLFGRSQ